jgi:hypothetical protein
VSLRGLVKKAIPRRWFPLVVRLYGKSHLLYFAAYRLLFRPNPRYLAVAEKNHATDFPPEWTSVNIDSADILVNLETDYHFERQDIEFAYSGHTIEHLSDDAARRLFRNLFAAMKPGAVLRVECPDLDMLLDDYKCVRDQERKLTKLMLTEVARWKMPDVDGVYAQEHIMILAAIVSYFDRRYNMPLPPLCSAEDFREKMTTLSNSEFGDWAVSLLPPDQLRESYEHRNWFNFAKLSRFLTEAGFSGVVKCEPGETRHHFRMNIDRKYRSWYSMFVEAVKN